MAGKRASISSSRRGSSSEGVRGPALRSAFHRLPFQSIIARQPDQIEIMPFFDLPQDKLDTYRSSAVAPADFDSFWAATLSESRSKPLDAVFEPFDAGLKLFDVFDVTFAGFGGDKVRG